jgi:hypothetical protein
MTAVPETSERRHVVTASGYVVKLDSRGRPLVPEVGAKVEIAPSLVADPFGGVGCGGVVAAYRGLRWLGCELEPRFIALAEETFALHRGKWEAAGDIPPTIVQGDSRRFAALVAGAAGLVTSPPYADTATVASGVQRNEAGWGAGKDLSAGKSKDYGTTPGQLGALKAGDADSVVTSPPYAESNVSALDPASASGGQGNAFRRTGKGPRARDAMRCENYGTAEGSVGNLPAGDAGAVVTSPPWEDSLDRGTVTKSERIRYARDHGIVNAEHVSPIDVGHARQGDYGTAPGQVGALRQETYWSAMAVIWRQAFLALCPNGVLCCVIKDFVRAKKRVPLCDQTWRLLLSLGFLPVGRVRCLLSEETREPSLFGGEVIKTTSRKSFFRRLAEGKGSPAIDAEEILVVRKGAGLAAAR